METSSQSNIIKFGVENKENSDNIKIPATKQKSRKKNTKKRGSTKKKHYSRNNKNKKIIKLTTKSNKKGLKIGNMEFSIDDDLVDFCFKNIK